MARYSLTDNEFKAIETLITYSPERGRKPTKIKARFDGILWILCSGAPWRDLPSHHPPHQSVYHRSRYYQKHGILEQAIETPLWFILTAGNVNDSAAFEECLNSFLVRMDDRP